MGTLVQMPRNPIDRLNDQVNDQVKSLSTNKMSVMYRCSFRITNADIQCVRMAYPNEREICKQQIVQTASAQISAETIVQPETARFSKILIFNTFKWQIRTNGRIFGTD